MQIDQATIARLRELLAKTHQHPWTEAGKADLAIARREAWDALPALLDAAERLNEANGDGQENCPLRMFVALRILRAWNHGTEGFESITVDTVHRWIDAGMKGPIPWPESPFFADWAERNNYSDINGYVGFKLVATLTDAGKGE